MYQGTSPILGQGTVSAESIDAWFAKYGTCPPNLGAHIVGACAFDPGIVVNHDLVAAQIAHETGYWTSAIAVDKWNPAGLGAENDAAYAKAINFRYPNGTDQPQDPNGLRKGVAAQVAHLLSYIKGDGPWAEADPRYQAVKQAGWLGTVKTLNDLNGKWAYPGTTYGAQVAARANALVEFANDHSWDTTVVDISGFTPPKIVDQWFPVNGVSYLGEPMDMHGVCVHQTGNTDPGAEAQQNVAYMNSQACIQRQASWHDTVGLNEIIRTIPHDKQAYHASDGSGPGNTHYAAVEHVVCYPVGSAEYKRVMLNGAWYVAKSLRDAGLKPGADTLKQHHDFARDGKDCPAQFRDNGQWPEYVAYVQAFYDQIDTSGGQSTSQPGEVVPNALILPGNPHGDVPIVLGFKAFVETLAQARYPQDLNAAVLSLVGYPEAVEYKGTDGNSYQVFERTILQWNPNNQPPFDVVMLRREDSAPEAA